MMTDAVSVIATLLKADTTLMNLLPANRPYGPTKRKATAKKYSIIPAGLATGETLPPFITLQAGPSTRQEEHMISELIYIRAYDDYQHAAANISKILHRIFQLLDDSELELTRGVPVKIRFDGSLALINDDPIEKNFIEAQYRLISL